MKPQERLVYGIHAVTERLRAGANGCLYVRTGKLSPRLEEIIQQATQVGCKTERLSQQALDAKVKGATQGVVLAEQVQSRPSTSLDDLLAAETPPGTLLLLDGVTDPGNLGACLRSAATLGAEAVIAPKNASAPLNADARKRAAGAAELVPYLQVVNLARCIDQLKDNGIWIIGTTLDAPQTISQVDLTGRVALVMGSEGRGLRQNTIKHCDLVASIPMVNDRTGYNVSVATGICLYEVYRQRMG